MSGRPRKRAAETALADAADPDLLAHVMAQVSGEAADLPPGLPTFDDPARPQNDRQMLEHWWREQFSHIERTTAERQELFAGITEHPFPTFARQAKMFGAFGMPRDVAALLLEMSEGEFALHYGAEYTIGSAEMFMAVSQNFMRIALSSNDRVAVKAATEFLNRRGGEEWRPPAQKIEVDDSRKTKGNLIDSKSLSYDDRQALKAIIERSVGRRIEGEVVRAGLAPPDVEAEEAE
jgi:hypothetical protein